MREAGVVGARECHHKLARPLHSPAHRHACAALQLSNIYAGCHNRSKGNVTRMFIIGVDVLPESCTLRAVNRVAMTGGHTIDGYEDPGIAQRHCSGGKARAMLAHLH